MTSCSEKSIDDTPACPICFLSFQRKLESRFRFVPSEELDTSFRWDDKPAGLARVKATNHYAEVKDIDPLVALNAHTREHIDHWLSKFPPDRKRSALIQGLMAAQEQNNGYLNDELITAVAKYLELPAIWAYEVATFYSMFETKPVGRNNVAICTNISCWLNGGEDIVRHCEKKLGIKVGESTPDGRVYLKPEEECLAACAGAPMMVVNGHYHEYLTTDKVDQILDELK